MSTTTVTLTSGIWTCPAGVNTAKVECYGSGGRGAPGDSTRGGGGGGGGGYAMRIVPVHQGTNYQSYISRDDVIFGYLEGVPPWVVRPDVGVSGRTGGVSPGNGVGGAGGGGTGDVVWPGGNGASTTTAEGGGGGAVGGPDGPGQDGSGTTGGTGAEGFGDGGTGGTVGSPAGTAGQIYGGGSGGKYAGNGGINGPTTGKTVITYTDPVNVIKNLIIKKVS